MLLSKRQSDLSAELLNGDVVVSLDQVMDISAALVRK
jgi:hypothetical protein